MHRIHASYYVLPLVPLAPLVRVRDNVTKLTVPKSTQESDPHTISSLLAVTSVESSVTNEEALDRKFAEALSDEIVESLKPLIEGKDTKTRPAPYCGAMMEGLIDGSL